MRLQHYTVSNLWYSGEANILTYEFEGVLATKLCALYQRRKGRDLFDLDVAIKTYEDLNYTKIATCAQHYFQEESVTVTRALFEKNLSEKINYIAFLNDTHPLLPINAQKFEPIGAAKNVHEKFITQFPGEAWQDFESSLLR